MSFSRLERRHHEQNYKSIREWQERLIKWNYLPPGSSDGMFGPMTDSALLIATGQETKPLEPVKKSQVNSTKKPSTHSLESGLPAYLELALRLNG